MKHDSPVREVTEDPVEKTLGRPRFRGEDCIKNDTKLVDKTS